MRSGDTERRPLVSVVVPFFNGRDLLSECLTSLLQQSYEPIEILAVDDASSEGPFDDTEAAFPSVTFVRLPVNGGFCVAANAGIAEARGEYVALLNNDAVPQPDWLENMVEAMESSPDIGACASKLLTMGSPPCIESAGDSYKPWRSPRARAAGLPSDAMAEPEEVFGACAAAALYRMDTLREVGSFDEDLGSHYEDVELSFRLWLAGYSVWYVPSAVVHHQGHASYREQAVLHQVLRNDVLVYVRDMPATLFWLFLPAVLARQLYQLAYFSIRGHPGLVVRAKIDAAGSIPCFLRKRSSTKRLRKVSLATMMRAFTS